MLEAIRMIGSIFFIASVPIALGIGMYNTYHPEAEKKMHETIERHKKLAWFCLITYVLLSEVCIILTIANVG